MHFDPNSSSAQSHIFAPELVDRMVNAYSKLDNELTAEKNQSGYWPGELSVSALSTATAISALSVAFSATDKQIDPRDAIYTAAERERWKRVILQGSDWLAKSQNPDGGFGDTNRSISNIATTLLVLAAWELAQVQNSYREQIAKAQQYVQEQGHWDGLRRRYGKDKTFVVPIMTNCALAGQIAWSEIPTLPFEAAALPQSWYRFAKMPVVSYAVPALVAIGQAQLVHNPPRNPIVRSIRNSVCNRTLNVLNTMQPESGGYLEATPLTSFVLMNLASIGLVQHPVCRSSIRFILDSVTEDGSWPIDTNLATWVTSLSSRSYYPAPPVNCANPDYLAETSSASNETATTSESARASETASARTAEWRQTLDWILSCQHRRRHPFTGAEPGGWGWTNLSGSVPDSDDTPAALLTLANFFKTQSTIHSRNPTNQTEKELTDYSLKPEDALSTRILEAAGEGCEWLIKLQNSDGGWPTFCRGWGTLPFDRSGSDLTAHAIRALHTWEPHLPSRFAGKIARATSKGWKYLAKHQYPDGSWQPLWFGNQDRAEEDNPFYGTARVLLAFAETGRSSEVSARKAVDFLKQSQNEDGSWGGGPSIRYRAATQGNCNGTLEETAVVLEALIASGGKDGIDRSIMNGLSWVCGAIDSNYHRESQPIGFYFAKLWYHEKQYPLAFSLAALRKGLELCQ